MTVNQELERMWKEALVGCFAVPGWQAWRDYGKAQTGQPVLGARFEHGTPECEAGVFPTHPPRSV